MATVIKTTGETIEVQPKNGRDFKLEELYALVGTDIIEVLYFPRSLAVFCEEGKLRGKALNLRATEQALDFGWIPVPGDVGLVGDVLFCKRTEIR